MTDQEESMTEKSPADADPDLFQAAVALLMRNGMSREEAVVKVLNDVARAEVYHVSDNDPDQLA
jgi:hypothetical protein